MFTKEMKASSRSDRVFLFLWSNFTRQLWMCEIKEKAFKSKIRTTLLVFEPHLYAIIEVLSDVKRFCVGYIDIELRQFHS